MKWFYVAWVLAVVLAFPLIQASGVYAAESTAQEKTLSFLTDVILLDLTKYNVTLVSDSVTYPAEYGGLTQEEVRYKLETNGSDLDVTFVYRDSILAFGTIYVHPDRSPLHYTQAQPANLIDTTKGLLERYQKYTGSSRYQELRDTLDLVAKVESTTVTLGNVKLRIYAEGRIASFAWAYLYNGLEKPGLDIVFSYGAVETINDQWNLFKVGSTTVSVSKEEAISIARERAKSFSWKVGLDPNATEIKDFKILDEPVKTSLGLRTREPLTLYPHWLVTLYFDKTYPGSVIGVEVGIWADTGEIHYIIAVSTGGGFPPPPEDSTVPPTEPPSSQQPGFLGSSLPVEYGYAIVTIIVVAIATAAFLVYFRKIKKTTGEVKEILKEPYNERETRTFATLFHTIMLR